MSGLQRKASQVSRDFRASFSAVIRTGLQNENSDCAFSESLLHLSNASIDKSKGNVNNIEESSLEKRKTSLMKSESTTSDVSNNSADKLLYTTKSNESQNINSNYKSIKIPNILKSLFPLENSDVIPFERTSPLNMPFNLTIIMENEDTFNIKVCRYYTVDKVIDIISKKKSLLYKQISLFYKNMRLPKQMVLSKYHINNKSHLYLKTLKKFEIKGKYQGKLYPISVYTSESVNDLKNYFSRKFSCDPNSTEIIYDTVILKDNKELYLFDIKEGCILEINNIVKVRSYSEPEQVNKGHEIVKEYLDMIYRLQTCDCKKKRINAIAGCILSVLNKNHKEYDRTYLNELDENRHHKSCIKSKSSIKSNSLARQSNQSSEVEISETSATDVSLDDCIKAQLNKIEHNKKMLICDEDLENLSNAVDFKEFKFFLKPKIGTTCNLTSVSMLYNYGIQLVTHIGGKTESDPRVAKVLQHLKSYFEKYFEKQIMEKGGMVALSLSDSEIEE